ncbi:hypothetical protein A3K42_00955 [candidate division WWE3 bacterium RBG_13_37_7]|uniref:Diacylglycerol kinase n=1 Tax=candidate division WWE3 bacterium RBG_13_37_7 TaxID=1802609 RepID=A0A1F4U3W3_UNCKA|nr:MAG: hypothetical protein A3K42_00955 [candidate division WWE3 bacterium RBG_13_37_7]
MQSHHPVRRAESFQHAFEGLFHALINEANFRIQVLIVIVSVVAGIYFKISTTEWSILTLAMGFLLFGEIVNTVVEEFTDHIILEESFAAKVIKDLGAGFVLVSAITTLIILFFIFGNPVYEFLQKEYQLFL